MCRICGKACWKRIPAECLSLIPVIAEVKQYLEALDIFQDIRITRAGGVISSHCGPGTLGVLYYTR